MKKDNLMFAILGLLVGSIAGFMFANNVSPRSVNQAPAATGSGAASTSVSGNSNLPANHPPIGTSSGSTDGGPTGAALPQVAAAIDKARKEPQNFEAQMIAGDLYYQIQKYEEAAKFYEAANKLKPADNEAIVKAGNAYFDGEKYEQAEKWYVQALEKNPKDVNVRTDLGLTFFLREPRDVDRAIKEYKTGLSIDPNNEITLQNLALAYKEKGDTPNLNETLDKMRKVNPNNPVLKGGGSPNPS